jgi:hypothetical protein
LLIFVAGAPRDRLAKANFAAALCGKTISAADFFCFTDFMTFRVFFDALLSASVRVCRLRRRTMEVSALGRIIFFWAPAFYFLKNFLCAN